MTVESHCVTSIQKSVFEIRLTIIKTSNLDNLTLLCGSVCIIIKMPGCSMTFQYNVSDSVW